MPFATQMLGSIVSSLEAVAHLDAHGELPLLSRHLAVTTTSSSLLLPVSSSSSCSASCASSASSEDASENERAQKGEKLVECLLVFLFLILTCISLILRCVAHCC